MTQRVKRDLSSGYLGSMPSKARDAGSHLAPPPPKRDVIRLSARKVELHGSRDHRQAMGAAEVWFVAMEASGQDREEPVEIKISSLSKEGQAYARDLMCYLAKGFRW